MRRYQVLLLLPLLLAACGRAQMPDKSAMPGGAAMAPPAAEAPAGGLEQQREARHRFLAYEHTVALEAEEARVAPLYRQVQEACQTEAAEQCVVLRASLEQRGSAQLRLRAKAPALRRILALLGSQGKIVRQSLAADDLAGPVEDSAKRLAMLTDYRARLEGLRERAASNIEALIKVSQELAQVQSQIEAAAGERARLMQRIDTELFNISIYTPARNSAWRRIGQSFGGFGQELANGIAGAVTAAAWLLPFSVVLFGFGWVLRKLWRLRKPQALPWRKRRPV